MAMRLRDRWSPGVVLGRDVSGSMQAVGGLFAMSFDAVRFAF
ncbi:MAG TPA: ABC transporter permease, partial [Mycobacterium sp.]|nr:ABC transporter permease [Mycobacterium sp.]HEU4362876.1 ABC transporter permease [Mycobacterium sp.]